MAQRIFTSIETAAAANSLLQELLDDLIHAAVEYARIRTDWALAPPDLQDVEGREARGAHRTAVHNSFIVACNVLGRQMEQAGLDATWREVMGEDRREIGDFACYLHAILGIQAR